MTGQPTTREATDRAAAGRSADVADAYRLAPAQQAAALDVDPAVAASE
ncbi:hypothetical protein [Streptomyces sp. T028]